MLKAVLFDLDGTLGDTLPFCITAFKKAIEPLLGKPLAREEITSHFGKSEEGMIAGIIPGRYEEAVADFRRVYVDLHHMCPAPFPGMRELLAFLREKGVLLAVVTGKGAVNAGVTLDIFGLRDFFADVEVGFPHGPNKEAGINAILGRRGIAPTEALYVGDVPGDVSAARNCGVGIISAAWSESADREALAAMRPDAMFTTVAEFANHLRGLLAETTEA